MRYLLRVWVALAMVGAVLFLWAAPLHAQCGAVFITTSFSSPGCAAHYVFLPDGSADVLAVDVSLLNLWGMPISGCPVVATMVLTPGSGPINACPNHLVQTGVTGPTGQAHLEFSCLGGYGEFRVELRAGSVLIATHGPYLATSPDLDGSCDVGSPALSIIDLGMWASCLPPGPPQWWADFDCSGDITVIDLGRWASGLNSGC